MRTFALILPVVAASMVLTLALGCETESPSTAVVENAFPVPMDGGDPSQQLTVYRVWYSTTLFLDPVSPGQVSDPQRTVPGSDYAYALLAVGWDPSSTAPPATLIALRSSEKFPVKLGDVLDIRVSDDAFVGNCAAGKALSQADADFITQRIFPGSFANLQYNSVTCTSTTLAVDGGAEDGGGEGEGDAAQKSLDAAFESGG